MTTPVAAPPGSRLGRLARGGAPPALIAQFVQAGTSLVLQVLAARNLGLADFGTFSLLLAVLVFASALHVGWFGDSLMVLDRHRPEIRSALQVSVVVDALGGGLLTAVVLAATGLVPVDVAALFGVVVAVWLAEETFRRLLMARLQFWRVVGVDGAALLGSLGYLGVAAALGTAPTLAGFLVAVAAGQALGVVAGLLLTPRGSWTWGGLVRGGLPALASVGTWRALQTAIRPLMLLVVRALVAAVVTTAALGELEAARLFVAPGLQVVNGAGSFLLPTLAARVRRGDPGVERYANRAVVLLTAVTLAGTAVAAVAVLPLGDLVSGGDFTISPLAVVGWGAYAASVAATIPFASLATVRQAARAVFWVRLVEACLGVALAGLVLALGALDVAWVPFGPALAGVVGAVGMRTVARRSVTPRTSGTAHSRVPEQ